MFQIKPKSFKARRELIQEYQVSLRVLISVLNNLKEQGKELEVLFKCVDGEQRCSRLVLNYTSTFFDKQLKGRDRMGNEPVFNYDYPKVWYSSVTSVLFFFKSSESSNTFSTSCIQSKPT